MAEHNDGEGKKVLDFYRRLSPAGRVGAWIAFFVELVLIIAAERDIHRRPAEEIRGPKVLWRAIAMQNVVGPAAYFTLGRKRSQ